MTADHALVGLALLHHDVVDDVAVQADDFTDPRCSAVWATMRNLRAAGQPTDPLTVLAALPGDVRGVDGPWLADLVGAAPVRALADHHARLVMESATRRRLAETAARIRQGVDENVPAADLVEMARGWIDSTSRDITTSTGYLGEHLSEFVDQLDSKPDAVPTPWADLNHLIGGWRPGCMYVIGARPGAGKTLMAVQAALGLAEHGHVAVNNLEMSKFEVDARIIAQTARVNLGALIDHRLTEDDWAKVARVLPAVQALPLSIIDDPRVTTTDVRSHARTVARRGKLAAVVVDYIQLMRDPSGGRRMRSEVVAEFSRDLKILAKELHVPVLVLAQLNRGPMGRAGAKPMMSDLKESGALEQDADVVILLSENPDHPEETLTIVDKNRWGAKGEFQLIKRGHYARLDNYQHDLR
ncbi:replicative DNA helicase [Xylanimonas oleitrophica]|nr:DnaB-like helicase C-terminal domain-containing protein [Xylanimonas oleitrophica]